MTRFLFGPVLVIPALVIAAQFAVAELAATRYAPAMTFSLLWGFRYSIEPIYPETVALILGVAAWRYTGLGIVQMAVATVALFLLPVAASYLLAYAVAVYLPFQINSIEDYTNGLLSLRAAVEGFCRLLILTICVPAFRSWLAWFLIFLCWSGATILLFYAYLSDVIAASYPLLVRIASVLGFVLVGAQFQSARANPGKR